MAKQLRRLLHRFGHLLLDIDTGVTKDDKGHMYCKRCKRRLL